MDGSRGTKDFGTEPAAGLENTNMDFPAGGKINTISVVYRSPTFSFEHLFSLCYTISCTIEQKVGCDFPIMMPSSLQGG